MWLADVLRGSRVRAHEGEYSRARRRLQVQPTHARRLGEYGMVDMSELEVAGEEDSSAAVSVEYGRARPAIFAACSTTHAEAAVLKATP